jgi:hypothetical protein
MKSVLALSLLSLVTLLVGTVLIQNTTIEQQRALIHNMLSNSACMGVQPTKAPEALPYSYQAIMGLVPNPPQKGI